MAAPLVPGRGCLPGGLGRRVDPRPAGERPLVRDPEGVLSRAAAARQAAPRSRLRHVLERLEVRYGRPRPGGRRDPLDELILTVLSQNTNDRNRDRAYEALRSRYPRWEDVLRARDASVAAAIRAGGLANQKARRIRRILARLREEHGSLDLSFLRRWSTARISDYLGSFVGVGEKTIRCVLLFSLGRPAFPVDTHIHRLGLRLGLLPKDSDAAEAHRVLGAEVPARDAYSAHLNLIRHGREVCHARRPACGECVLSDLCPARRE